VLPDDRELLSRAVRGDRLAFDQLYLRHVRPVYWQAYSVVRNELDAEDVTQEVFITTWKKIATIRMVDDSLLPWLLVTARYTALNKRRQTLRDMARRQDLDGDLADKSGSVEETVEHEALLARVNKCVAELSGPDRQLYELCISGDRTYAEAAKELGVSHGAVRNRVSRIRNRLRADIYVLRGTA
ncbi:MAG: RNA polymerase sigma factor, partial [Aeromicrobium sp.]